MNAKEIIQQAMNDAGEWVEMSDNPAEIVAGVLATKIVELNDYITYLQKRIENDSARSNRIN